MLLLWFLWVSFLWWQASSTVWVLVVLNELFLGPVFKAVTNVNSIEGCLSPSTTTVSPTLSFSVTRAAS